MMRDVTAGADGIIALQKMLQAAMPDCQRLQPPQAFQIVDIAANDGKDIINRAILDGDAAVHEELAETQRRVRKNRGKRSLVGKPQARRLSAAIADTETSA